MFPWLVFSQLKLIDEKPVTAKDFSIDNLGNFYFIKNGKVLKTDRNMNKIAEYSNNFLGDITYTDVSNPFRILIYYKDFNQIIFLDSHLAELKSPVSLDDLGIYDATAVCYSLLGGFWVYRNQKSQVIRFSQNLRKEQKGTELSAFGVNSSPRKMTETTKNIFIHFENDYIFILDNFGSYHKKVEVENIIDFRIKNNFIYTFDGQFLSLININTLNEKKIPVFYDNIRAFDIFGQYLYCLTDKSLITFLTE